MKRFAKSEEIETKIKLQLKDLSKVLIKSQSKDQIDQRAEEIIKNFSGSHNKAARKQIAEILFSVQPSLVHLIPFYSRLAATITVVFPEFGQELLTLLQNEFNVFQKKKDIQEIDTKIRNVRFICELTKFGVCPA